MEETVQMPGKDIQINQEQTNATVKAGEKQFSSCAICLEDISELATTKPCTHEFDFICIAAWLEQELKCPLCKAEVRIVEYGGVGLEEVNIYTPPSPPNSAVPLVAGNHTGASQRVIDAYMERGTDLEHARRLQQQNEWHSRHIPQQRERGPAARPSTNHKDLLRRRKRIYTHQLYSLHVGTNSRSHYQELSAREFAQDERLAARARKWIRRELGIFEYLSSPSSSAPGGMVHHSRAGNAEWLLEYIIAMLKSVDIKGSNGQAEDMLQEYLGRANARLFLHELRAWLRSPYTELQEWDCAVQYADMVPSLRSLDTRTQDARAGSKRRRDIDHFVPERRVWKDLDRDE